jgi:hypothetical protein
VCTFAQCPKANHFFDTRHDWFKHEQMAHRREWYCTICDRAYCSRLLFQDHFWKEHSEVIVPIQLQTLIDKCERPIESKQQCPFCGVEFSPGGLEGHLASHMQQISLFVLGSYGGKVADDADFVDFEGSVAFFRESNRGQMLESLELDFDLNPWDFDESNEGD